MSNTAVVGAYWGDEGKGKIIDLLASDADWVVRFNGGDNAGHTIVAEGRKVVLHVMPSGVLQGRNVAIGPDVFFNPETFLKDYEAVVSSGFRISGRILIDERAHMIMPYHVALDAGAETGAETGGGIRIGTTRRGIGPAAKDRASRTTDISVADLVGGSFRQKLLSVLAAKKEELIRHKIIKGSGEISSYADSIVDKYSGYAEKIKGLVGSASYELNAAISNGSSVLLEGAQAALLDIVHGTRPFVTSSNTTAGGAFANLGLNPKLFKVIGVVKAYPTRVGEGLFPTELKDELGKQIQSEGGEFGATTGRQRKVGFPDFVALKYSAMINAADEWAITKPDVLAGKRFRAAVAYEKGSERTERFPFNLEGWKPVYSSKEYYFEKFSEADAGLMAEKGYAALPEGMKEYIKDLVQYTKVPVSMISLSPKREITVVKGVLEGTMRYLE
ncbi:adenylosuccinate synthase [Candidatus Woesearchaeota archaeon]|nr:adenylosuccinate synthase [Candidatus Woesearchaeota archaeon]